MSQRSRECAAVGDMRDRLPDLATGRAFARPVAHPATRAPAIQGLQSQLITAALLTLPWRGPLQGRVRNRRFAICDSPALAGWGVHDNSQPVVERGRGQDSCLREPLFAAKPAALRYDLG